jgi:ketosteroid isomerase-like protein
VDPAASQREKLRDWIASYEALWRTPGTDSLGEIFAPDAFYSTGPYEEPHMGLDAIARMWEAERSGPDEQFEMESEVIAVEGDTGVARVHVRYGEQREQEYRDLWVVRFNGDGRCAHFEEWPFWPPGTDGTIAAGRG